MKIPYFCCIGAELKRYAKDFDFMNQVYLYKVPTDDTIEEVLAQDYFQAISDTVLQDDLVYIYEASENTLHSCKFDKQNGHITAVPLASDETLTGAVTTIIHDNLTKNRAVISNNDGKIAVSEVTTTELGYLSGATSNIQEQLNNKANAYSYATNCITEIPQDINLELNNGTLTLKAGSKVYVPNGAGVFDVVNITADKTTTTSANGVWIYFINESGNLQRWAVNECFSGTTAPTSILYPMWYDTTNNIIKISSDYGSTWSGKFSLPIAIVTVSNGAISSIDQIFNGFGYIGSTEFVLPNVGVLIPNGRNADGTLNNIKYTTTQVATLTINGNSPLHIAIRNNGTLGWWNLSATRYDANQNLNYYNNNRQYYAVVGKFDVSNGQIKNFTPYNAFHAVDYNDTDFIAHQAMPSDRYVDLTLGTSGTTYTAPADGYYCLRKQMSGANKYLMIQNTSKNIQTNNYSVAEGNVLRLIMPVSKNDSIMVTYDTTGATDYFKFIYANGAK